MSLLFDKQYFENRGSFEEDIAELFEKATTTETFHYRVIVNLENPFKTAVDVAVVTNELGARMIFKDNTKGSLMAATAFHTQFFYSPPERTGLANVFYSAALMVGNRTQTADGETSIDIPAGKNTDHPEIRWCIDPRLLDQASYKKDDRSFLLIPIEKAGLVKNAGSPYLINLSSYENNLLKNVVATDFDGNKFFSRAFQDLKMIRDKIAPKPSICLVATACDDLYSENDPFPRIFIHAEEIPFCGLFPALYGLEAAQNENYQYTCAPGKERKPADPAMEHAKHAMRMLGLTRLSANPNSIIDWKNLASAMKLYSEGYEAGRDAAIRSRKADELAGD